MDRARLFECNRCGLLLPENEFYVVYYKSRGRAYRRGHCKSCDNRASRDSYRKNGRKYKAKKRAQYDDDPWNVRLKALLKRCAIGWVTAKDLKDLYESSGGVCFYCGDPLSDYWAFDHALPVSKGGDNSPVNLRVSCIGCNSAKKDMTESEFLLKKTGIPF